MKREGKENIVHSIGSFLGSHGVMVSNAKEAHVRSVQVIDYLHISKHSSVSAVIDVVI